MFYTDGTAFWTPKLPKKVSKKGVYKKEYHRRMSYYLFDRNNFEPNKLLFCHLSVKKDPLATLFTLFSYCKSLTSKI